jgi:hypothetical protein
MNTKRIFMNEADAGSGNGAAPPPAAPPAPPAESAAPAIDLDALVARLSKVIDEKVEAKQNIAFAKLRKDGVLKQDKPSGETPAVQPTPSVPVVAQAGLSMADVETLLERKGVIASRAAKFGLSDAQTKRFEAALASVPRESLATEADTYLADMGLVRTTEQPVTQSAQPQVLPTTPPISDKGSPAPGGAVNWEREFAESPLSMSPAAKALMNAKHGEEKARKMRVDAAQAQLSKIKVTLK